MHPAPKANLRSLFDQAIDLSPIDRAHFLRDLQFRSPLLYAELRSLLLAHEGPSAFFEQDGGIWSQIAPMDFTGRRFGAYSIVKEIGRGGMGAVYQATRADEAFHKTVAIKLISGAVLAEAALDSFRRERQILAQLEHPNIARLLDGGSTDDGLLYLIMEFVDGQPLDQYIENHNATVEEILKIFLCIASAVSFAHQNLIVHRDLKPSNILVTEARDVKLLDFGIAKVLNPGRDDTATVAVRLTPQFASPEQIRGESISTASDVYSLGVLLFHSLTRGRRPYRVTSQAVPDILQAVLDSEVPRPSSVAPPALKRKLRGDLDNIILKAMAKEPGRRYSSVAQFSEDIERHLSGRPILAQADNWSYRVWKFARRHQLVAGATVMVLLSTAAGTISTLNQARIAQTERIEAIEARAIAEAQRKHAIEQRQIALDAQSQAERQRLVAEQRSKEALTERRRAEAQTSSAETRYQSVRSLATSILVDVNESLKDVPGSGPARTQAVLAALKHLEALSRKSGNDSSLQEDLASAYEQSAEIMGSLFDDDREASALAMPALIQALQIRMRLGSEPKAKQEATMRLAETHRLLGNGYLKASQFPAAIQSYQDSLAAANRVAASPQSLRLVALAKTNLCTAYSLTNQLQESLSDCQDGLRILAGLESKPEIDKLRIQTRLRYASTLRRLGQIAESILAYKTAVAEVDALDLASGSVLDEMLQVFGKLDPAKDSRPLLAATLRKHGVLQSRLGKRDQSLESFEQAMRIEASVDPPMKEVLAYAEAAVLQSEAQNFKQKAQMQKAIEASKKALNRIGESSSGSTSLLREEIEASLRSFESSLVQPPQ